MNKSDVDFAVNVFFPVFLASYEAQIRDALKIFTKSKKNIQFTS